MATTRTGFSTWIWSTRHWGLDLLISMPQKRNRFGLTGLIKLVVLMWIWMGLFFRKNHLWRCWCWLSLLNRIGALYYSIAKAASKRIGALVCSTSCFTPEIAHYLYKSTIQPCMEYCCLDWAGAPSCYLELLYKLQKRKYRTAGPSLAASLEPLAHRRNVASLSLFYRHYFTRYSSEMTKLVTLPYSRGRSTRYSDRLHDFFVTIPRCYKDVYVNSFFNRTLDSRIL